MVRPHRRRAVGARRFGARQHGLTSEVRIGDVVQLTDCVAAASQRRRMPQQLVWRGIDFLTALRFNSERPRQTRVNGGLRRFARPCGAGLKH